jgi:hypothetical protein
MDFYDMLDQIVHLLRSRGRVSYRALQRQFALDDALLADLKAEILYAQHPVVEDGDRGLVWTGDTGTPSGASHALAPASDAARCPRGAATRPTSRRRGTPPAHRIVL